MPFLFRWGPALAHAALIFWFSHQPDPPGADVGPDYMLHFFGYVLFGILVGWGATDRLQEPLMGKALGVWWLAAAGYGLLDEFHQSFIPGRTASGQDWLADAVGAFLGLALVKGFQGVRR
ncbi:MAG: hypothetical protein Kow00109_23180 [Acidobacteriota bacterium]